MPHDDLIGSRTPPRDPNAFHSMRASSFEQGASQYRTARPSYPVEAARWLTPGPGSRVLDLAAGTGKLTEVLVTLDLDVVAVEPSDAMRAELTDALPGITALAGTAESIPLPDDDVDGVVVAQAWHWFRIARALPEIGRVLRPGGRLGVTWNVRDHRVDWVDEFTRIIHRGDALDRHFGEPTLDERFTAIEHDVVDWVQDLSPEGLRLLAASRSHLLTVSDEERAEIFADIDRLCRTHPDLAGKETFGLPYRTHSWRARRR